MVRDDEMNKKAANTVVLVMCRLRVVPGVGMGAVGVVPMPPGGRDGSDRSGGGDETWRSGAP
jgi:hypothetical protein